ncbi:MAG TPA: anti-sigma factor [Gemmatimonadales bacterium]|nr:anti-sigma factor [Gemmatimonadales bacterium]
MSDWLGMSAPPRAPRPELKAQVLVRAAQRRGGRRYGPWLAAAAVLVVVAGGASWTYRRMGVLEGERARLLAELQAARDSLSFIMGTSSRVIQIPVSTNGRVGAVTIFADSVKHRWLVRCEGLAPNARGQSYQLWFLTNKGARSAAVMAMDTDTPMVLALDMPPDSSRVMGAAMSIETRQGSAEPRGPMVFHLTL